MIAHCQYVSFACLTNASTVIVDKIRQKLYGVLTFGDAVPSYFPSESENPLPRAGSC